MGILVFLISVSHSTIPASLQLPRVFNRLECFNNKLFLAPRIGKSISELVTRDSLRPIPFTDEVNYRIYDFRLTPFTIYINRGTALEKFYIASGKKETIYTSPDIVSFTLTPADEIVLADRQSRELIFLDFAYQVKFKIENISILDVQWHDTLIYALTKNRILIYDEYGNLFEKRSIPEPGNRIIVDHDQIILFTEQDNCVHQLNDEWRRIEFPFGISDLCVKKDTFVILDGNGDNLHILSHDDF
ncbi:hypothetical protein AMJ87_00455 [candidate division WOR_3 bacterium SM23_60]|uniref:Uncharacterized protein n=1 Tax=candidate division WOR_3 bacterium SM23_60 TaxID=1703780 RepID=A0A0S8GPR5_UNCW3|nr:MAG: hypothetical protein AMJ87_00455 [candidate division WOR_3 bacterium SM23_60]